MIDRLATLPVAAISAVCRRHPVAHLDVFGSVLRDDFRDDSDIDLLVTFLPDSNPTIDNLIGLEDDMTEALGRKAHVTTRRSVIESHNPVRRGEILGSIRPVYCL